ncbi:MAG: endonuclease/exonuclease/phosphatase family protein [Spirochaetota bacterium]|jgi:endonuclease/exonuclease/phosphatase family metal-dependent hydrolase|nr:endonuclease/exonuclease/phosphatase family protein [Spirochaetota bacterium]
MKRRQIFFVLVLLFLLSLGIFAIVCDGAGSQGSSSSAFSEAEPGTQITIAVFNAEDFNSDKAARTGTYATVADIIATNAIDVIVFCECEPWDMRMLGAELANRGISMTNRITTSNTSNPDDDDYLHDEVSIWSRFRIVSFSQVLRGYYTDPVSGESVNAPRYFLRACVDVGGRAFWFYGGHLKATSSSTLPQDIKRRRAQARALEELIKASHNPVTEYITILGDMNTTEAEEFLDTGTLGYLTLKSDNPANTANDFTPINATYFPMPGGYTWKAYTGTWESLLDHIIISPALMARYIPDSAQILMKGVEPRISDHYPIMLRISLE